MTKATFIRSLVLSGAAILAAPEAVQGLTLSKKASMAMALVDFQKWRKSQKEQAKIKAAANPIVATANPIHTSITQTFEDFVTKGPKRCNYEKANERALTAKQLDMEIAGWKTQRSEKEREAAAEALDNRMIQHSEIAMPELERANALGQTTNSRGAPISGMPLHQGGKVSKAGAIDVLGDEEDAPRFGSDEPLLSNL